MNAWESQRQSQSEPEAESKWDGMSERVRVRLRKSQIESESARVCQREQEWAKVIQSEPERAWLRLTTASLIEAMTGICKRIWKLLNAWVSYAFGNIFSNTTFLFSAGSIDKIGYSIIIQGPPTGSILKNPLSDLVQWEEWAEDPCHSTAQCSCCQLGCSGSQNLPCSKYRRIICSCSFCIEHPKILLYQLLEQINLP